jgi:uncharacterized protein (TIGR02594 family)
MEPKYIIEARALLGEKEVAGKLANEKIVELYEDAGHKEVTSDEVPWCAAFVGACLARANLKNTGTLLARDYANYGIKLDEPEENCIGVMKRGNSGWEGHVGFVVKWNATRVWLLGGNQNNSVSVSSFPRAKFIAFVKPNPKVADLPTKDIVKASRRMKTQSLYQKFLGFLTATGVTLWQFLDGFKEFVKDNTGLVIVLLVATTMLVNALLQGMGVIEYKEGRYLPSFQWK